MVSGSGTSGDPFILTSLDDLELIGTAGYALNAYYKLGSNIDASGTADPEYNEGAGWAPISNFAGSFDGDGYEIQGLYINRPATNNVGLIGTNNATITITDLILSPKGEVGEITGLDYVGGIIGYVGRSATITGCTVKIPINGEDNVGGLVGVTPETNYILTIQNCQINTTITGSGSNIGGVCGVFSLTHASNIISNCTITGEVNGSGSNIGGVVGAGRRKIEDITITPSLTITASATSDYVGGIIGYAGSSTYVTRCTVKKNITGRNQVGGIIGGTPSSNGVVVISSCYYDGTITAASNAGGIIGLAREYASSSDINTSLSMGVVNCSGDNAGGIAGGGRKNFTNCYSTSTVTGAGYVGGLIGQILETSTITNCYSKGAVSGSSNVGGLVGAESNGTNSNSFWDTQTSGQASSALGTGKTTAEMKTGGTYTDAGWDFSVTPIWVINGGVNSGYPYLYANPNDQSITCTGIASGEVFGSATVTGEDSGLSITPNSITSGEAFGSPQLNQHITGSGITSGEGFGSAQLNLNITTSGISSGEAFGSSQINLNIPVEGVASGEVFGVLTISGEAAGQTITTTGIGSGGVIGSPLLTLTITTEGIVSGEVFGTPSLVGIIKPSSITSGESFGSSKLNLTLHLEGIPSDEAFGTPRIKLYLTPTSISSTESFGTFKTTLHITPTGITTREDVPVPFLIFDQILILPSIGSGEALGEAGWIWHVHIHIEADLTITEPVTTFKVLNPEMELDVKNTFQQHHINQPHTSLALDAPWTDLKIYMEN